MEEVYNAPSLEANISLRDLEEKNRLLRDRVLLLGQSVIEERDKTFKEVQEMKGTVIKLKEEVNRLKELMQRMAEQISQTARKDEIMILQRQLDLLRGA